MAFLSGERRSMVGLEQRVDRQNKSSGLLTALGLMMVGIAYGIQHYFGVSSLFVIVPGLLVIAVVLLLLLIRLRRNNPPRSGS